MVGDSVLAVDFVGVDIEVLAGICWCCGCCLVGEVFGEYFFTEDFSTSMVSSDGEVPIKVTELKLLGEQGAPRQKAPIKDIQFLDDFCD